jgi:hypothetical protein
MSFRTPSTRFAPRRSGAPTVRRRVSRRGVEPSIVFPPGSWWRARSSRGTSFGSRNPFQPLVCRMLRASRDSPVAMPRTKSVRRAPPPRGIHVLFVAGFGPIVKDPARSRRLYANVLGIDLEGTDGYFHTEKLEGAKGFGLWPLSHAARSCFGKRAWPKNVVTPQAWLEFDVTDVAAATEVLQGRGYRVLVANRTEPWGQTVSRFLSPEGVLVGVTHTPWMRAGKK